MMKKKLSNRIPLDGSEKAVNVNENLSQVLTNI